LHAEAVVLLFDGAGDLRGGSCPIKDETVRINQHIRVREVRLIGHDGAQIGVVPIEQARQMADEVELDLVEVAPQASPPVCRIMDFKRLLYEKKRREKEARKKTRHQELKEIKLRPSTDDHDFDTKMNHAREFLDKGHKVKLTLQYRGREMAHQDLGMALFKRVESTLADAAEVEATPSMRGRSQSMVVAPKRLKAAGKAEA